MLELKELTKIYKTKSESVTALNKVNLYIEDTGMVFIVGRSGSGKTTMLNVIGGLDRYDSGDMIVDGKSFNEFSEQDFDNYRNTFIGFIFQEYNLLNDYNVEKNIGLALELQGKKADRDIINKYLAEVDLEGLNKRKTSELSGGQRQRIAIARALVKNPRIIMADEPTGALDFNTGRQVMDTLKKLSATRLVIIVSHDMELATKYADRIITMSDGRVISDDTYSDGEIHDSNVYETDNELSIKEGVELTDGELKVVKNAVKEKKTLKTVKSLSFRNKHATPAGGSDTRKEKLDLIKGKMSFKNTVDMGVKSLKVKPFRLIFTIILSAVAFAVFGLFDTLAAYDDARILANVIRTSDYSAISLEGIYKEQIADSELTYNVGFTDSKMDALSKVSGLKFRPVYSIGGTYSMVTNSTVFTDINEKSLNTGRSYYVNEVNGYVEFNEGEFKDLKNSEYGLEIITGRYPENDNEVAIPLYLAETLYHYDAFHIKTNQLTSGKAEDINELIGYTVTLRGFGSFIICGIIDCGKIPEKYDVLKTSIGSSYQPVLTADLKTYVNSGLHTILFLNYGYTNRVRSDNRQERCYTKDYETEITFYTYPTSQITDYSSTETITIAGNDSFYCYDTFSKSNVFFLDPNKTTLNDGEVIMYVGQLKGDNVYSYSPYSRELTANTAERDHIRKLIGDLQIEPRRDSALSPESYQRILESYTDLRPIAIETLCRYVYEFNGGVYDEENPMAMYDSDLTYKTLKVTKKHTEFLSSKYRKSTNLKIVGFYYDVDLKDPAGTKGLRSANSLVMTANDLNSLGVYPDQGHYTRVIAPLNITKSGANKLAKYMTDDENVEYSWYKNSVLTTIKDNGDSLKQVSDLFLYISIALAVFSMFMTFSYITTSILNKRPAIGILRGLGSNGSGIFFMFFTESFIISLINACIATIIAYIGCIFVNNYIQDVMSIGANFAIFGARQIIIIFVSSIVIAFLSSLFPIIKIAQEKPVELIRRFD